MSDAPSRLAPLSRREDPAAAISERFLRPWIGGGRTVAVLSEPLGARRPVGVVLCHSLGLEQTYLARLEVQLARALSGAGFPVLRYHGQGYGDSEGGVDVGLGSHLRDASEAVSVLRDEAGAEAVGVLGIRFGGMVALLVAARLGLPQVGAIEPVVSGGSFMRSFLRSQLFADWTARVADDPAASLRKAPVRAITMEDVDRDLQSQGWADIRGFRLTLGSRDEIAAADLITDLTPFDGRALIVAVSRSGEVRGDLRRLSDHLGAVGATPTLIALSDPNADTFGQYNLRMSGGSKHDLLASLADRLATDVVSWFREPDERAPAG